MCLICADIPKSILRSEPVEQCPCITMMFIDGAIAVAQAEDVNSEYPLATTAWQALKAVISSEGGEIQTTKCGCERLVIYLSPKNRHDSHFFRLKFNQLIQASDSNNFNQLIFNT